jgi:hypothetical protein
MAAILGAGADQVHPGSIARHQHGGTRRQHQKCIRPRGHRDEQFLPADPPIRQPGLGAGEKCVRRFLPGRQHQVRAAEQVIERRPVQQPRGERRPDQRLRHEAGAEFLDQRAERPHPQARAASRLLQQQPGQAERTHLAPYAAIKSRFNKAQHADAPQVAARRCDRRGAVADHANIVVSLLDGTHFSPG